MLVFQVLITLMYLTYSGVITWPVVKTIVEWRYYGDMYCLTAPIFLLLLSDHVRKRYMEFYKLKNGFSPGPVTLVS
ncbi:hypothetical protein AAVH_24886 [Aphelenchoides avenae]|nr:hypothetical protein AAVH_24886 [Aphelenchus avenae]